MKLSLPKIGDVWYSFDLGREKIISDSFGKFETNRTWMNKIGFKLVYNEMMNIKWRKIK